MEDGAISKLSARSFPVASRRVQLLSYGSVLVAQAFPMDVKQLDELIKSPGFQYVAVVIGILFVFAQVVTVFAHWIASKAVADKGDATLRNGFKLWLYHLAAGIACALASAMLLSMVAASEGWQYAMIGGGMLLLGVLVFFLVPMKIYRIGFWAALGMLLLSGLMQSAVMLAVQLTAVHAPIKGAHFTTLRELSDSSVEKRRRLFDQLSGKAAPDEIDRMLDEAMKPGSARKSLAERAAAVKAIQRKLDERRRSLPPSDTKANARFQRQLERYKRLLKDVKAEHAAALSARA
jgi:hypothetical protein